MSNIQLQTPFTPEDARRLRSGDSCLISGVIYTARDAAHKRLCELLAEDATQEKSLSLATQFEKKIAI